MSKTFSFEADPNAQAMDLEKQAREIVLHGDFESLSSELERGGLLQSQTKRSKEFYQNDLETTHFLTERDWELMTILDLYSPELATHSIETFKLAQRKIENIHIGAETIADLIRSEDIALETFYRACLLHDIGKTAIPEPVLNRIFIPGDWQTLVRKDFDERSLRVMFDHLGMHLKEEQKSLDLVSYMTKLHVKPEFVMPVHEILSKKELEELRRRGISTDLTFREIIELHEPASQNILESEGLTTEALIAGQHHNYRNESYRFPISSQTVGVSANLADLLHLADKQQALLSERPYKKAFSRVSVYEILIEDTKASPINNTLTASWIQDELHKSPLTADTDKDREKVQNITAFVEEFCS